MPQICEALIKAAYDPRIKGLYLKIGPLGAGWAKLKEIRDHLSLFRESGKFMIAAFTIAGEKEYYLASACPEIYMPPTGRLQLTGFSLAGERASADVTAPHSAWQAADLHSRCKCCSVMVSTSC